MSSSVHLKGQVQVTPPLNAEERAFVRRFTEVRHMHRRSGPYSLYGGEEYGHPDIMNANKPHPGQPDLWCDWEVSPDGRFLTLQDDARSTEVAEWLAYLIDHFLRPGAVVQEKHRDEFPFFQEHVCETTTPMRLTVTHGEDAVYLIDVADNEVTIRTGEWTFGEPVRVSSQTDAG